MAYYSEELIEEVISQNDVVEVISEYVQLRKSGRNFMGLCPFHREKTPSFCVSLDKQIYKCFGCGEGGNVISFIMKIESLDFWDAIELLAERAHIDLSRYEIQDYRKGQKKPVRKDLKETLYKIHKEAAIYYHQNLMELLQENKNPVKDYIERRKLDLKTIKKFGIGYATGKIPLYDHLKNLGFQDEDLFASGIIMKSERGKLYDRFFARLVFPIIDIRDRVIAFGGRVLDNSLPKYINSSENEIYHKGKTLYGMNIAKREDLENIIIVEGYMDAIALQKSGFHNAVASLGTALTDNQARLIKKYTDKVVIGYDQDGAGQEATMRGLDILTKRNLNVKVLILDKPDAKDPDEYVNKYGPERLRNCVKNSISLIEFKIARLEKNLDENNLDSKIHFLTEAANILAGIENDIERDLYIDKIARKYHMGSGPIIKEVEKRIKKVEGNNVVVDMQTLNRKMRLVGNVRKRQEQYIVALLLCKDVAIQNTIWEKISPQDIEDQSVRAVYAFILKLRENYDINKIDILSKMKEEEMMKEMTEIMYIDMTGVDRNELLNDVLKLKNKERLYLRRDEILNRLNQDISKDEQEVLTFELNQLYLEISKLKK